MIERFGSASNMIFNIVFLLLIRACIIIQCLDDDRQDAFEMGEFNPTYLHRVYEDWSRKIGSLIMSCPPVYSIRSTKTVLKELVDIEESVEFRRKVELDSVRRTARMFKPSSRLYSTKRLLFDVVRLTSSMRKNKSTLHNIYDLVEFNKFGCTKDDFMRLEQLVGIFGNTSMSKYLSHQYWSTRNDCIGEYENYVIAWSNMLSEYDLKRINRMNLLFSKEIYQISFEHLRTGPSYEASKYMAKYLSSHFLKIVLKDGERDTIKSLDDLLDIFDIELAQPINRTCDMTKGILDIMVDTYSDSGDYQLSYKLKSFIFVCYVNMVNRGEVLNEISSKWYIDEKVETWMEYFIDNTQI